MSAIIALAQRKGGVGKTTLAVNVAGELSRRGLDVGLVDADPQRSACVWAELGQLNFDVHEMSLRDDSVPQWAQKIRDLPHTHVALDDAIEQGALFCNMLAELRRDQATRDAATPQIEALDAPRGPEG